MIVFCNVCERNVRVSGEARQCPHCGNHLGLEMNWTPVERKEQAKERRRTGQRVQRKTRSAYCGYCEKTVRVTMEPSGLVSSAGGHCPTCNRWVDVPEESPQQQPRQATSQAAPQTEPVKPPRQKGGLLSGLAGLVILAILCSGVASWLKGRAQESIKEADKLYAEGKQEEAVRAYKKHFSEAGDRKPELLKRIVEYELKQGDRAEARHWVEKGIDGKLEVAYDSEAARGLLADVQQERGQQVKGVDEWANAQTGARQRDIIVRVDRVRVTPKGKYDVTIEVENAGQSPFHFRTPANGELTFCYGYDKALFERTVSGLQDPPDQPVEKLLQPGERLRDTLRFTGPSKKEPKVVCLRLELHLATCPRAHRLLIMNQYLLPN